MPISKEEGEDKLRRAQEKAEKAIAWQAENCKAHEVMPDCDCYGSMFSHDVDCAINLDRIDKAGYKLVRKDG